jgi:hypothetical protein
MAPFTPQAIGAAKLYLNHETQREVKEKDFAALLPETHVIDNKLGHKRPIIMVGGRVKTQFRRGSSLASKT